MSNYTKGKGCISVRLPTSNKAQSNLDSCINSSSNHHSHTKSNKMKVRLPGTVYEPPTAAAVFLRLGIGPMKPQSHSRPASRAKLVRSTCPLVTQNQTREEGTPLYHIYRSNTRNTSLYAILQSTHRLFEEQLFSLAPPSIYVPTYEQRRETTSQLLKPTTTIRLGGESIPGTARSITDKNGILGLKTTTKTQTQAKNKQPPSTMFSLCGRGGGRREASMTIKPFILVPRQHASFPLFHTGLTPQGRCLGNDTKTIGTKTGCTSKRAPSPSSPPPIWSISHPPPPPDDQLCSRHSSQKTDKTHQFSSPHDQEHSGYIMTFPARTRSASSTIPKLFSITPPPPCPGQRPVSNASFKTNSNQFHNHNFF